MQDRLIGLSNQAMDKLGEAIEAGEAEAAHHWLSVIHGCIGAIQRAEHDPNMTPFGSLFRLEQGGDEPDADNEEGGED